MADLSPKELDELKQLYKDLQNISIPNMDSFIKAMGGMDAGRKNLQQMRQEFSNINSDVSYLSESLTRVLLELKGQNNALSLTKKSYSNISSIANKLKYDRLIEDATKGQTTLNAQTKELVDTYNAQKIKDDEEAKAKWDKFYDQKKDANAMQVYANAEQTDASAMQNDADKIRVDKKRIYIPSLSEVELYFKDNGYTKDSAVKAFHYYAENNWKDSRNNQVKNWKQKMQGVWFKDENLIKSQPIFQIQKTYLDK